MKTMQSNSSVNQDEDSVRRKRRIIYSGQVDLSGRTPKKSRVGKYGLLGSFEQAKERDFFHNRRTTVLGSIQYAEDQLAEYVQLKKSDKNNFDNLLNCIDEISGNMIIQLSALLSCVPEASAGIRGMVSSFCDGGSSCSSENASVITRLRNLLSEVQSSIYLVFKSQIERQNDSNRIFREFPEEALVNDFIKAGAFAKLLEYYWILAVTRLEFFVADRVAGWLDADEVSPSESDISFREKWMLSKLVIQIYKLCLEERKRLASLYTQSDIQQHAFHSDENLWFVYIPSDEIVLTNALVYQYTQSINMFYERKYYSMIDIMIRDAGRAIAWMEDGNPVWQKKQNPEIQKELQDYNDTINLYRGVTRKISQSRANGMRVVGLFGGYNSIESETPEPQEMTADSLRVNP